MAGCASTRQGSLVQIRIAHNLDCKEVAPSASEVAFLLRFSPRATHCERRKPCIVVLGRDSRFKSSIAHLNEV